MKKNIKTTLKTKEKTTVFEGSAIIQKHSLQYFENDVKMSIEFDDSNLRMLRKTKEYEIEFIFNNESSATITLMNGLSFSMNIEKNNIEIEENYILISYILENEKYEYKVEY